MGLGTVLLQQLDKSRTHRYPIGDPGHLPSLLRRGELTICHAGHLGVFMYPLDYGAYVKSMKEALSGSGSSVALGNGEW